MKTIKELEVELKKLHYRDERGLIKLASKIEVLKEVLKLSIEIVKSHISPTYPENCKAICRELKQKIEGK